MEDQKKVFSWTARSKRLTSPVVRLFPDEDYYRDLILPSGEALFTWLASDHVSPSECYNPIGSTGTSLDNTWDYFVSGSQTLSCVSWTSVHNPCQQHINSIDLSDDGNYLISSRHCYTLYFINGTTGDIIWQMGGANSSFTMGNGTNYSWQHHARWITKNDTYATITWVSYPS